MFSQPPARALPSEGMITFILCAVQFVHIIDLMMVIPLGPDFARELLIPLNRLGWVGGAYTLSSALAGIVAAVYLDRYDRKKVLMIALAGLTVMTGMGALAWDFTSLVVIRFITGVFGGPCTAICFAIVADCIPESRRGTAMGRVMAAFSLASIAGVPFGLELAHLYGWRAPFVATALAACVVCLLAWRIMPSLTRHLSAAAQVKGLQALRALLDNRIHWLVFLYGSLSMFAAFLLIPHLATFVQYNLGLPREQLGLLYMAGGVGSFVVLQVAGRILNRVDASKVAVVAMGGLLFTCYGGMIHQPSWLPPLAIYVLFMASMSTRGVSANTLASKIPAPHQRAGFLALMNCVSQLFAAVGAFVSTALLHEAADKSLQGFDTAAWLAILATVFVPLIMWRVERRVRLRDKVRPHLPAPETTV